MFTSRFRLPHHGRAGDVTFARNIFLATHTTWLFIKTLHRLHGLVSLSKLRDHFLDLVKVTPTQYDLAAISNFSTPTTVNASDCALTHQVKLNQFTYHEN